MGTLGGEFELQALIISVRRDYSLESSSDGNARDFFLFTECPKCEKEDLGLFYVALVLF